MQKTWPQFLAIFLILFTVTIAMLTVQFPAMDLHVSSWWYDEEMRLFPKNKALFALVFYYAARVLAVVYGAIFLIGTILGAVRLSQSKSNRILMTYLFLLLSYALSAGVMVHLVYKPYFGRARPLQTVEFAGEKPFTPAYTVAGECTNNCSFVSGHAAMGYALGLPCFISKRRRYFWLNAGLIGGWVFGAMRIVQGAHFLSDVAWSGIVVLGTAWAVYLAMRWTNCFATSTSPETAKILG